ncbi:MAG TPA: hypothetical protein VII28_01130 [Puia sp.]
MFIKLFAGLLICSLVPAAKAQDFSDYRVLHFTSAHTAFPDTGRANGHLYDSVLYTTTEHYSDSSVLLIIPRQLKTTKMVDLVFWFHGWRNNIDTAAEFYKLTRQFITSGRNAVLVLAETAKNSPDSYGGKLEQPGMFSLLTNDVLHALKDGGYISGTAKAGNIVLAGHSGAFRVIAYLLQNGQMPVQEVFLFDALYAEVDKYQNWLQQDWSHHFVHWYTNHGGGTDEVSEFMMQQLKDHSDHYLLTEEIGLKPKAIKDNYILFVHSLREHNVIINDPDDFQLLLENSFVLRPIK